MTTFRTRPPRKKRAPRAPRLVMTSVKPGSVPQNRRASSRPAAVQRLCPSIRWTVSPGRTLRATASSSDVTTGPSGVETPGVTISASRRATEREIPGPTSLLPPTKPDHRVRLAISTVAGTTMQRAWDRRESKVTRHPRRRSPAARRGRRSPRRRGTPPGPPRRRPPTGETGLAASPIPTPTPWVLRPANESCAARAGAPCASSSTRPWSPSTSGVTTPLG